MEHPRKLLEKNIIDPQDKISSDIRNVASQTCLMIACHEKDIAATKLYQESMADINAVDAFGRTALHFAVKSGCLDIVKILMNKGAAVNATTLCKETALHFAAEAVHTEIADLLFESKCPIDSKYSKFRGIDPRYKPEKKAALHLAIKNKDVETVKRLLKFGADLTLRDQDNKTPLQIAAENGYLEIAQELVTSGADVNDGKYLLMVCFDLTYILFNILKNQL